MNKFESNPNSFALDVPIKSEHEIKEEDVSFDEEYSDNGNNLNSESLRIGQLSNGSIPISTPMKTSCSNIVKFETLNNEEKFKISEVYIKDYELKTEIIHEEFLDDNIQDGVSENGNIMDDYEKRFEEKDFVQTEERFSEINTSAPSSNLDMVDWQLRNETVGYEGNQYENVDQMEELSAQDQSKLQKRFQCSQCEYKTDHKGDFNKHLPTHLKTKLFKCSECNYECNQKCSLIRHMLIHSKRKLFKCSDCDYECNQKYGLNIHLLTHSNTKLFKCTECEYECNKKYNLKVHLLTHTKTKLFKCPKCVYECNRKGRLKIHILMHSKGML